MRITTNRTHSGHYRRGPAELVRVAGRSGKGVLSASGALRSPVYPRPGEQPQSRTGLGLQQLHMGAGRDSDEAQRRHASVRTQHPATTGSRDEPGQRAEDVAREHRYWTLNAASAIIHFSHHARAVGSALFERCFAVPVRVHPALVPFAAQHSRQRREGVRVPRHLLHDQPESARSRDALHLPLRRDSLLEHAEQRAALHVL